MYKATQPFFRNKGILEKIQKMDTLVTLYEWVCINHIHLHIHVVVYQYIWVSKHALDIPELTLFIVLLESQKKNPIMLIYSFLGPSLKKKQR